VPRCSLGAIRHPQETPAAKKRKKHSAASRNRSGIARRLAHQIDADTANWFEQKSAIQTAQGTLFATAA
jgi:hypothetical protein